MKFRCGGDVVIHDGGSQCAEFATCGGETVGGGTDWSWVDFSGDKEGNGVGAELVEEGGKEVHGLELCDVCRGFVVIIVEARDDEEDEVHEEANHLHLFAAVKFIVNEEGYWKSRLAADHEDWRNRLGSLQAR